MHFDLKGKIKRLGKIKYLIFPTLLILLVLTLATFHIHGSSMGEYYKIIYNTEDDPSLLFGQSRGIRSDEWVGTTPIFISQMRNNLASVNPDVAYEINQGYGYGIPTDNIFTIFRPQLWIFFLTNNMGFAFSFYWWFRIFLLVLSFYLLLLEITKKNSILSVLGSLLLLVTPFIQWWLVFDTITMISFGILFFIRLIKSGRLLNQVLSGIGLTYSLISFALILYPPFQIPLAWVALFIGIGVIIQNKKELLLDKKSLLIKIVLFTSSAIITGIIILLFIKSFEDVINLMTGTIYPGSRFIPPGMGDFRRMLSGFFNILLQKNSNGVPFGNQSEASNFFMLYPFLGIWMVYSNIKILLNKKSPDWIGLFILISLLFLTTWYLLPLPEIFSKLTFLYMVPADRLTIALGFANYLIIINMLSKKIYVPQLNNKSELLLTIIIVFLTGLTYYKVGLYLYELNNNFFSWPAIVSDNLKILGVTLFTPILVFLVMQRRYLSLAILVIFGIFSTILVNPLYQGLDTMIGTPLAKEIQKISSEDDSPWIIYGQFIFAHYSLANGAHVINGMHNYPQFEIWNVIDPERKYQNIYNRFAHVIVSEKTANEEPLSLIQNDAIELNINPCDSKLDELQVKYILSTVELQNTSCLEEVYIFQNFRIFRRNN